MCPPVNNDHFKKNKPVNTSLILTYRVNEICHNQGGENVII